VYGSSGVSITSNQVTNTQFGIAVVSSSPGSANSSRITSNTINATHIFDAIDVCSNNNTISSNTINGADESGIHLDDTCTGSGNSNSITNNTTTLSCAGLLEGASTTGNSFSGNFSYDAVFTLQYGDVCGTTPSRRMPSSSGKVMHKVQPSRL